MAAWRKRILIVDDDRRLGEMLVEYLGGHGFEATLRGDAASASMRCARATTTP